MEASVLSIFLRPTYVAFFCLPRCEGSSAIDHASLYIGTHICSFARKSPR